MPDEVKDYVSSRGVPSRETFQLDESVMSSIDVLYMTRVQKERFPTPEEYAAVKDVFRITPEIMAMVRGYIYM